MSGRTVILIMAVAALVMSVFFYRTLKNSPQHRELATNQMEMEFQEYVKTNNFDKVRVAAQKDAVLLVDMKGDWNFLVHDRTLIVTPPPLTGFDPATITPTEEALQMARTTIHSYVYKWLLEKYKTEKDLKLEIRFANEPLPQ